MARFCARSALLFVFVLGAGALTSCVVRAHPVHEVTVVESGPRETVVVEEAPPEVKVEVVGVAPSPNHVWVAGYWTRHGGSWVWVGGTWVVRPRAGVAWVPGHWDRRPRGWVWIPGHWA